MRLELRKYITQNKFEASHAPQNLSKVGFTYLKKMRTVAVILCFILMGFLDPIGKYYNLYNFKFVILKELATVVFSCAFFLLLTCNLL